MSMSAYTAWMQLRKQWDELIESLSPDEWAAPSACDGWAVRDVVAHLAASARGVVDPLPEPERAAPLPENRERVHDVMVARRADWSVDEVVAEYRSYGDTFAEAVLGMQTEPVASSPLTLPGLGTYPMHLAANANVFDYYCHLHHDVLAPGGPVARPTGEADHVTMYAVLEWMMAGLPQMQGAELDDTVTAPVTFRFSGPGASEWTVSRPDPAAGLEVVEEGGGDVVVTSTVHSFVAWGTKRCEWRPHVTISGPEGLAMPLLDALDIV